MKYLKESLGWLDIMVKGVLLFMDFKVFVLLFVMGNNSNFKFFDVYLVYNNSFMLLIIRIK